jgi:hypothetical protein
MSTEGKIKFKFSRRLLLFSVTLIFFSALFMFVFVPEAEAGSKTFTDEVHWDAIATKDASADEYYNWTTWVDCPGVFGGCYISKIEVYRTFSHVGAAGNLTEGGESYIKIANSADSNCTDPSLANFVNYIASVPANMDAGDVDTAWDCGADQLDNVCALTSTDGYATTSPCFSVYAHGDTGPGGNVIVPVTTVEVRYTWTFDGLAPPDTPILKSPEDQSVVPASPVVLSWDEAADATYYEVYGDTNATPTTLLATTTATNYQWSLPAADIYFWRIRAANATTGETTVYSATSTTWSFDYDPCAPRYGTPYDTYPMYYTGTTTDTIIVWGDDGTGTNCGQEGTGACASMGSSSTDPITFENIYEFGQAVRGACAVTKPAAGTYSILTNLYIASSSITTYVKTTGESVDFGKQLRVRDQGHLISGELTAEGNPYAGSTLSCSGTSTDPGGQFYLMSGSEFQFYDSFLLHKKTPTSTDPSFSLDWEGEVTAKRSSLENWWNIRFLSATNTLEDIVITNVGQGFYPATAPKVLPPLSILLSPGIPLRLGFMLPEPLTSPSKTS